MAVVNLMIIGVYWRIWKNLTCLNDGNFVKYEISILLQENFKNKQDMLFNFDLRLVIIFNVNRD